MEWWKQIQPSWRTDEGSVALNRKTPRGETWQVLRKGGTAGIYVVVMALSWWIKAQQVQRDNPAWMAVDDLSWVMQQMMLDIPEPVSSKRARDDDADNDNEAQLKKRYANFVILNCSDECIISSTFRHC
jgi:hypothetical protein